MCQQECSVPTLDYAHQCSARVRTTIFHHLTDLSPRLKKKWLKANCVVSRTKECSATATRDFGTSPTSHPFSTFSLSPTSGAPTGEKDTDPTTPHAVTSQHQSKQNTTYNMNNTNIDNKPKTEGGTKAPPPRPTTQPPKKEAVSLPVIYIILIVASSLSFILVVSGELTFQLVEIKNT